MDPLFTEHLNSILGEPITSSIAVSGGDIAETFRIETASGRFLLKTDTSPIAATMFTAEHDGLQAIAKTGCIGTPSVIGSGVFRNIAYLLMEFIASKTPNGNDYTRLGQALASLHNVTHASCGWHADNYIGRLPQQNTWHKEWKTFYHTCRLQPQLRMARDAGLLSKSEIPGDDIIKRGLDHHVPDIQPALLHGDLWAGNYLISTKGAPYLIDPSVHYGHGEADLAMSRLFGGFDSNFYKAYDEVHPPAEGSAERRDLYQLYYLLVHLNMFGMSYHGPVMRILSRYFQ